jgi:mannose-1-phosphate guanylyltransferase
MKAMILAAGLGTRLQPLTDGRPKALVEISGRTLLEINLLRLSKSGIREVIINVHHFSGMVIDYLKANNNFGMQLEISCEDVLLDTGGGLKKAAWFFLQDASQSDEPFLLHNVDVLSTIDFHRLAQLHAQNHALATLAIQKRESSRYLLFDDELRLCGRRLVREHKEEIVRPSRNLEALAFSGVHLISPRLLGKMQQSGVFSIIDTYLQLAAGGEIIQAFRADDYYWRDLGRPNDLAKAADDLAQHRI